MNAAAQYISDLTRTLVAEPAIRIRSTTARIRSRRHARLDTSPGEIRDLASELLLRGHEFAKLNAYPEDLRAQVTLGLWDICLPLERYFGMSDRAAEFDLMCILKKIAGTLDAILLTDPEGELPSADGVMEGVQTVTLRFRETLQNC